MKVVKWSLKSVIKVPEMEFFGVVFVSMWSMRDVCLFCILVALEISCMYPLFRKVSM